ncbi:toxin [Sulfuricurvum sp.]|jgi:uncharacterized DUF497 family protein|uniref:toxin n=1 Tax=Sulfuricurvum sp. TaxID=2025608 RepID=UPI003BB72E65
MVFDWNDDKNTLLKENRNVCFEDVVTSIQEDKLLDIVKNPSTNHQSQYCLIVEIMDYAYIVPFVKEGEIFFLKTIYPSRKQTKKYIKE